MIQKDPEKIYDIGVIHGRFQILHNDHIKYILSGFELCRHLIVGISNPDPFLTENEKTDPGRSIRSSNPLTYYERYTMIRAALQEKGVNESEFSIVPFPVNRTDLLVNYVPMDAVFFLSIYDDWGREKLDRFRKLGLKIHILREVTPDRKGISASEIRSLLVNDLPWEHLVPRAVEEIIEKSDLRNRLLSLL